MNGGEVEIPDLAEYDYVTMPYMEENVLKTFLGLAKYDCYRVYFELPKTIEENMFYDRDHLKNSNNIYLYYDCRMWHCLHLSS